MVRCITFGLELRVLWQVVACKTLFVLKVVEIVHFRVIAHVSVDILHWVRGSELFPNASKKLLRMTPNLRSCSSGDLIFDHVPVFSVFLQSYKVKERLTIYKNLVLLSSPSPYNGGGIVIIRFIYSDSFR